ncbi:hypothetical protein CPC08DRAFT_651696 [Agrocybe pediades]|nr:hypothetical protein CPC08DRAFT_651696 [Agrocybe pediades]
MAERDMKLHQYELSEEEWEIAEQLCDLLRLFKDATLFFSCVTPSIAMVIPAMDHIDQHLATYAINLDSSIAIRTAASLGKGTLNKYYNATDHSEVYHIAMVLHPRHKLTYFKHAG